VPVVFNQEEAKTMANQLPEARIDELMAALERDPRIDVHHHPVRASLREGQWVLEGVVKNIAAKKLIHTTARRLAGDTPILDQLRVLAAEPKEDGALRDEVCNLLLQEPVFLEYGLRVAQDGGAVILREPREDASRVVDIEVGDGTVIMSGTVGSLSHRRLAEALVWWTAGCEVVDNRLQVFPPEEDNDGELADVILMVLEKDPLVHASQLSLSVKDGIVRLEGYVASKEEKHLAAMDVWCVPGVQDVIDHIEARL
jgi:osmotically-inducible protein OsmY